MTVLLYATIWIALALFVVGAAGRRPMLWLTGAALCLLHITIAMGSRYGWSHQAAMAATARQTEAVYGLDWGGGVFVNYLFVAVWIADGVWRIASPDRWCARPLAMTWGLRLFYFVIIVNAAVVFASPVGRIAGVLLTAVGVRSVFSKLGA